MTEAFQSSGIEQPVTFPVFAASSIAEMKRMKPAFFEATKKWRNSSDRSFEEKANYFSNTVLARIAALIRRRENVGPGYVYVKIPRVEHQPNDNGTLRDHKLVISDGDSHSVTVDLLSAEEVERLNEGRVNAGSEPLDLTRLKEEPWTGRNVVLFNTYEGSKRKITLLNLDPTFLSPEQPHANQGGLIYQPGT